MGDEIKDIGKLIIGLYWIMIRYNIQKCIKFGACFI